MNKIEWALSQWFYVCYTYAIEVTFEDKKLSSSNTNFGMKIFEAPDKLS